MGVVSTFTKAPMQTIYEGELATSELDKELALAYGPLFVNWVTLGRLREMPLVGQDKVGIDRSGYHTIDARKWEGVYQARGMDQLNRPFIALRVQQIFEDNRETIEFVMTVFKRYPLDGNGGVGRPCENDYYLSSKSLGTKGEWVMPLHMLSSSCLTEGHVFEGNSWLKLRLLLEGEIVPVRGYTEIFICLKSKPQASFLEKSRAVEETLKIPSVSNQDVDASAVDKRENGFGFDQSSELFCFCARCIIL